MKYLTMKLENGEIWGVPVEIIARNRAEHYAYEFDGDVERSLHEDTFPLFDEDEYEIEAWATGDMDWSDFEGHQRMFSSMITDADMIKRAWASASKEIIEVDEIEPRHSPVWTSIPS